MQQAASYQQLNGSQLKSNNATPTHNVDSRRGDALWLALAGMFGSKLTSQFGDECPTAWHRMITELSNDEISRGIRWIRDEGREWPPSAPEFWRLCKKQEPPRPMPHVPQLAPPTNLEVATKALQELKRIVRS